MSEVCKIKFPAGYEGTNLEDDNIDTHVILDTGQVFFGTLFTIKNVEGLMKKEDFRLYFWATDMVILKDLELITIYQAIDSIIKEEMLSTIFCEIGSIEKIHGMSFQEIRSDLIV